MKDEFDCWAEIDLGRIDRNVRGLCSCLDAKAELMAVVKANAYGHGTVQAARAALGAGASWLGVARVDEGRALREHGIAAPILLMAEPPPALYRDVVELGLTATLYSARTAEALSEISSSIGKRLDAHLKIDTGMHRYGISPENAKVLLDLVDSLPGIEAKGIWTHFAVAEDLVNPYTKQQFERFVDVLDSLGSRTDGMIRHAANSAAIISFPESHLDLGRAGIAIYGIYPSPVLEEKIQLEPSLSMKARIAQVKRVGEGETISYGRTYSLKTEGWVATVAAGYADGLRRGLANCGEVLIDGRRHRISGNVTMDHFMVDLGDYEAEPGDETVLIGRQGDDEITAQEIAERLDTIPYEIVTDLGPRVPRIYLNA